MGIEEEGLSDVVSGLMSGAFSLGGGLGPILGGTLAAGAGFEWSSAAFGALMLADSLAVVGVWGTARGRAQVTPHHPQQLSYQTLTETLTIETEQTSPLWDQP